MKNKLYLIETVSIHRIRYFVESDCEESARDFFKELNNSKNGPAEFSQEHITEEISSIQDKTLAEYHKLFNRDNAYLSSWTPEQKLCLINRSIADGICDSRFMLPISNYLNEDSTPIEGVLPWSRTGTVTADGYSFSIEDERPDALL